MIHAFLSYNTSTKTSSYKSYSNIKPALLGTLLHALPSQPTTFETFTLSYATLQNTLFCLLGDSQTECTQALSHIMPILSSDPIRNILITNEVFMNGFNPIPIDALKNILIGESHEEVLYENMIRSKQAETHQRMKAMKKVEVEKPTRVHNLEAEMRVEKKPVFVPKGKKVRVQTDGEFIVTVREKLTCIVDKDNLVKECTVNGDISVKISSDKYKHEAISFETNVDCKFSPNVNKEKAVNGTLCSDRGFPVNRNVAVAKWKRECENPINFSLWASEEGECVVQLEYESDLDEVVFEFGSRCKVANGINIGDKVQWKGKDGAEIVCGRYEDMFPVQVDGWNSNVESINIEEKEGMTLVKIFEIEKYEIIY